MSEASTEPSSDPDPVAGQGLRRVLEDGALIPRVHELDLQRLADVLSELLRGDVSLPSGEALDSTRPVTAEERFSIIACGDMVARKLARLLEGMAELRAQSIELAGIVGLLGASLPASEIYAELGRIFDKFRQPYTIITADGVRHGAAAGDPRLIDLPQRSLAIDGVREVVWRSGRDTSLHRRVLLRRFLLFFALAPETLFCKEEVVRAVWGVDYHPLRHDPSLFTSMMRARRVIGDFDAEVLRSVEGGYRFSPPDDFLCLVETEVPRSCAVGGGAR